MKKLFPYILGFSFFFLLGIGGRSAVDYIRCQQYMDIVGSAAPAVSASGEARLYVDSTTKSLAYSVNGNSYVTLAATTPPQKQNYIINGDGALALRYGVDGDSGAGGDVLANSFGVVTGTDQYLCDRWKVGTNGSGGIIGCVCNPYNGFQMNSKQLTSNIATIGIIGTTLGFANENYIVSCAPADAVFDGTRAIVGATGSSSTVTYGQTNANIGFTTTGGTLRELNLISNTYMGYHQVSGSAKIMIYQPIEGDMTQQLRGKQVIVQFKAKGIAILNAAIIESSNNITNGTGVIGQVKWPNPLVNTWGGAGTDPTFNTGTNAFNFSYITPSLVSNGSIVRSCAQQTLSNDWAQYYFVTTLPTDYSQLGLVFWSDTIVSGFNMLALTEIGMFDSVELQPYVPRFPQIEKSLCQRYCYSMYSTASSSAVFAMGRCVSTNTVQILVNFPVYMRDNPNLSIANISSLRGQDQGGVSAVPSSITMGNNGNNTAFLSVNQAGATWTTLGSGLLYDAGNTGRLVFDADY